VHKIIKSSLICLIPFVFFPVVLAHESFQQEVNYKIDVALDDTRHILHGFQKITYINNSRDTLDFLFFHLWPNAFSSNNTGLSEQLLESEGRRLLFDDPELKGFIDSIDFSVDGLSVQWQYLSGYPDICQIFLNIPIKPGDTINITTPFRIKIPDGTISRLGHIGQSYHISHWYPKPAVYDSDGWHPMPYLNRGEFYSEFGSFDISITLPANYRVGATGKLQNKSEIEWLDSLSADASWKRTMYYGGTTSPPSSGRMKTIRYSADNVNDFAWFADKRFHVMKGSVWLAGSGKEITTWVMFTNLQARLWQNALENVSTAIWYFSQLIGDFPYENFTLVQSALSSGIGIKYPGLTVIGYVNDGYALDEIIANEVVHSWFSAATGPNERSYPFMSQGIASAYTARYLKRRYPDRKLWEALVPKRGIARFLSIDEISIERLHELEWLAQTRENMDQPLDLTVSGFSDVNYDHILNVKAAKGFNYLRAYLGDTLFDSAMQTYYQLWKSSHPRPDDLHDVFRRVTQMDLSWFFDDFISTTGRLDYKAARLDNNQLLVKNKAELESPLIIAGMIGDSVVFRQWAEGFSGEKWINLPQGDYEKVIIDPSRVMPEINRLNNTIRTSGLFPRVSPFQTRFLFAIEDPGKNTLVYIPVIFHTRLNGLILGLALHNGYFLPKPVEYFIAPFYSGRNQGLIGLGQTSFTTRPYNSFIRSATLTLEARQFGAPGDQVFQKFNTALDVHFRPRDPVGALRQKIFGSFTAATDLFQITLGEKAGMDQFFKTGYSLENPRSVNPYNLVTSIELNREFRKASLTFNYRQSYIGAGRGLDVRMFAGKMIKNTSTSPLHGLAPGGRSGREQYMYQGLYLDRFSEFTENFWSRQVVFDEGGLVSPVNQSAGFSNWLVSLSLTSTLPYIPQWVPVRPFANLLFSPSFIEAGVKAGIWDLFEIYFPFIVSENISSMHSFKDRIRFVISIDSGTRLNLSN
jgi:hypothetical protein